jgi:hypothetical protein
MAVSVQTIIDDARESINDDQKVRWPDAELLIYLKNGLDALYQMRPDLWHNQFDPEFNSDALELTTPSSFPISDRYRRMVCDYIIMRAETKDDQAVNSGRAAMAYQFFERQAFG